MNPFGPFQAYVAKVSLTFSLVEPPTQIASGVADTVGTGLLLKITSTFLRLPSGDSQNVGLVVLLQAT